MIVGIEKLALSPLRTDRTVPTVPRSLVEHIREHGQIQPVVVREITDGSYEILANAESWLGVQRAGLHEVDIFVREHVTDSEAFDIVNRPAVLDPITEAEQFEKRLTGDSGHRQKGGISALAESLRVSRSYVAHSLRLLTLPSLVQQALRDGTLKAGHGKALLIVKSSSAQSALAERAISRQWSVHRTELEARQFARGPEPDSANRAKSTNTVQLERALSDIVGSGVEIDEASGKLIISYQGNLDVLDDILARLGYDQ